MQRSVVIFSGPRQVEIGQEDLREPAGDELLVKTELSAISAGTEMLLYRGEIPEDAEATADAVSENLRFPVSYGYAAVGRVIQPGPTTAPEWKDRLVFGFKPHGTHFISGAHDLLPVPAGISAENAVFLANAETAVNLVQDAAPVLGERVLVMGQGVVGLLTAALLREFPLDALVTADRFQRRRDVSAALGVTAALDPARPDFRKLAASLSGPSGPGYDVVLELTGNPTALDDAIALTAFGGRVIVGSWYGSKAVPVQLGGRFHRSRMTILASQVSTVAPVLAPRWDKQRRFATAWAAIRRIVPGNWITQRFALDRVAEAYSLLETRPQDCLQIVLEYP